MNKRFYTHNDKLFLVLKEVHEDKIKNKDGSPNLDALKAWRDWIGADHVLRISHSYLLCETIQDLKFEEITEEILV